MNLPRKLGCKELSLGLALLLAGRDPMSRPARRNPLRNRIRRNRRDHTRGERHSDGDKQRYCFNCSK
jgi:hypothetical protein